MFIKNGAAANRFAANWFTDKGEHGVDVQRTGFHLHQQGPPAAFLLVVAISKGIGKKENLGHCYH